MIESPWNKITDSLERVILEFDDVLFSAAAALAISGIIRDPSPASIPVLRNSLRVFFILEYVGLIIV